MPYKDKEKQKEWQRNYMRKLYKDPIYMTKHKEYVKETKKKYLDKFKSLIKEVKTKCVKCGEADIRCLDLHHNIGTKEFSIARARVSRGIDKLKKEINKCICLCANCHRKLHAGG